MTPRDFAFNPADYGLPTREELVAYRIWDTHFHGFYGAQNPVAQFRANNFYVERMGIERSISLEIGGTLSDPLVEAPHDAEVRAIMESEKDRYSGITPIQLNQWFHLAAVRDDDAKTVRLYVNGVEESSLSYADKTVISLQTSKLLGGSTPDFPGDFIDGRLDEVGIYNRALSNADIQTLYAAGSAGEPGG